MLVYLKFGLRVQNRTISSDSLMVISFSYVSLPNGMFDFYLLFLCRNAINDWVALFTYTPKKFVELICMWL